jgi:hypothetical protein
VLHYSPDRSLYILLNYRKIRRAILSVHIEFAFTTMNMVLGRFAAEICVVCLPGLPAIALEVIRNPFQYNRKQDRSPNRGRRFSAAISFLLSLPNNALLNCQSKCRSRSPPLPDCFPVSLPHTPWVWSKTCNFQKTDLLPSSPSGFPSKHITHLPKNLVHRWQNRSANYSSLF